MILSVMFGVLTLVTLLQPTRGRFIAAAVYSSLTIAHDLLGQYIPDVSYEWYYLSAIMVDWLIIMVLTAQRPYIKFTLLLSVICYISMALNAYGLALWYYYLRPDAYNGAMLCLYAVAILLFLSRGGLNSVGGVSKSRNVAFRFIRNSPRRLADSECTGGQ